MTGVIKAEFRAERPLPLLRALPAPEAFPVEALGDVLGPAAEAIQDVVQSPWAMCSQAVLAAATLAVQGFADVELPTGQIKPISNFFLTVAGSGERKSATDSLALQPIRKHEEILLEMPKRGDAIAAAAPSKMTSAGVQTGQTAVAEQMRPRSLLGALRAARTTAKAHEPNQATWPRMMRTGPSRRPHWRPARPADAQLRRSDTRGDGPGRVVDVVVEKRQPAAQARIRGPAGLNRYSRTTVADHEIAHLSHCLAIKFSETAEGNCRQDLGVTIEIWGSSR